MGGSLLTYSYSWKSIGLYSELDPRAGTHMENSHLLLLQ